MKDQIPRILQLADAIAADIRERKLKPGDSYQTTHETAEMLGVSTTAANRAMQVLVKRRLLERRQRKGTFVAEPPTDFDPAPLRRVHLLVHENYLRTEGLLSDGIVIGMHEELPTAQVQFNFLPPENETKFVQELLSETMRSGAGEGFVLVRASFPVQRLVADSGLPAVVHGSVHPAVRHVPWIDRDHDQAARLIVQHLLNERRVDRILLLMRDRIFEGDHKLFDSVLTAMGEAGMRADCLAMRALPSDEEAIRAATREWLDQHGKERFGIICRAEPLAIGAAAVLKGEESSRVSIALTDYYRRGLSHPPIWPHIKSVLTPEDIGTHIGRMLATQARQKGARDPKSLSKAQTPFEIIPVQLET